MFVFPKWTNKVRFLLPVVLAVGPLYAILVVAYGASPQTTDVGYAPAQPIPYSHALHVGQLGMDCRYCHNTVEVAPHAAVPPTQTCINCHSVEHGIRAVTTDGARNPNLQVLHDAFYGTDKLPRGLPIPWVRVHALPGYAYFDHSAHVNRGVGCASCHGRIDQMDVVYQAKPLSMAWCLECHRDPGPNLRPLEFITDMTWQPPTDDAARQKLQTELLARYHIRSPAYLTSCSVCHR